MCFPALGWLFLVTSYFRSEHANGFSLLATLPGHWELGSEIGVPGSLGLYVHVAFDSVDSYDINCEGWVGERSDGQDPSKKCMCVWFVPKENSQSFPRKRTRASVKGDSFKTWLMGLYRTFDISGCLASEHPSHFGGLPNQMGGRTHKL